MILEKVIEGESGPAPATNKSSPESKDENLATTDYALYEALNVLRGLVILTSKKSAAVR